MSGLDAIAAERQRQIKEEGWTADHDDRHVMGELAGAASAYAMSAAAAIQIGRDAPITIPPPSFMFAPDWWKPRDARSDLIRAGALIAAEIDRLDRRDADDDAHVSLSEDAIVFGIGWLSGPKAKLSFGGDGAKEKISDRARAALNELKDAGYAVEAAPDDQIPNREHYRGTMKNPSLFVLARATGIDPFSMKHAWQVFSEAT